MKFFSTTIVLLIVVTLLQVDSAQAADNSPTNTPTVMPAVKVNSQLIQESLTSPSPQTADQQRQQVPGSFSVKTGDEMQKGRTSNFQDLLQLTPGVTLQSENGVEVSKISIRGSGIDSEDEPLGVEFLIDGLELNQGDGEVILEDVDVNTIDYAEIYRGASGFKYGAITLGGAINMVPFTGYTAAPYEASVEMGSYGFWLGHASVAGVQGPVDYYASVMARYRDGYRDHSRENTELAFDDVGFKISDTVEDRVYFTIDRTDRELPNGLTKQQMDQNPRQADPDAIAQNFDKNWTYERVGDKLSFKTPEEQLDFGVFYWHRELRENGFSDTNFLEGITSYYSDNIGMLVNSATDAELLNHRNLLTVGLIPDVEWEVDNNHVNIDGHKGEKSANNVGLSINAPLYAENQFYVTDKLSLLTGIQLIFAQRHFTDLFDATDEGDQSAQVDYWGWSPKVGAIYEFDTNTQVFANFSKSWQPPSFDNMVEFEDGPNGGLSFSKLDPQQAWTAELGTRGEKGIFDWDFAIYRSWLHDELLDVNGPQDMDEGDINVHRSYHQGIEAGLDTKLVEGIFVTQNAKRDADRIVFNQTYTLNDYHFQDDPVNGNNREAGLPIHLYQAELLYEAPQGFYAGPNVQLNITKYPVDQANSLFASPYQLLGFKMGFRQDKGFSVFVEAKNLLNQTYAASVDPIADAKSADDSDNIFHPGDGRSFYGGVSYAW